MRLVYLIVVILVSACSFDTSGLNSVNTNNTNNTDLCENKDCSGHGTCVVEDGTAICHCENNFTGDDCTECATGYAGETCVDCATDFVQLEDESCIEDPCLEEDCSGNGACSVDLSTGDASCLCDAAHQGDDCSFCATDYILLNEDCVLNPCLEVDCGSNGVCEYDSQAMASCNCVTGYVGDFCEACNVIAGYVLHEGECLLDPCFDMDCGGGICLFDEVSWTASCDCPHTTIGMHCEFALEDVLVYRDTTTEIAVKVRDVRWGFFNQTMRVVASGEITGDSTDFYIQSSVVSERLFISICDARDDEFVEFRISQNPHGTDNFLEFIDLPSIDSKDPHGIIYGDHYFQVECAGGEIVANATGDASAFF